MSTTFEIVYYVHRTSSNARTDEDAAMAFVSRGPVKSLTDASTLLADMLESEAEDLRVYLGKQWPGGDDWFVVRIAQLKQAARMVRANVLERADVGDLTFAVRRARLALA